MKKNFLTCCNFWYEVRALTRILSKLPFQFAEVSESNQYAYCHQRKADRLKMLGILSHITQLNQLEKLIRDFASLKPTYIT